MKSMWSEEEAVKRTKSGAETGSREATKPETDLDREQSRNEKQSRTSEMKKKLLQMDTLQPEPKRRQESLVRIQKAAMNKKLCREPSFMEIMTVQLLYISPAFWLLQGLLLLAACLVFREIPLQEALRADYMAWFSMMAVWLAMLGVWELGRHLSGRMAELEQSCYINLSQLWAVKLCLFGAIDFLLIICCCLVLSGKMEQSFLRLCLYLLVPYELSGVSALQLLSSIRKGGSRYRQLASGVFLGILAMLPASIPGAYEMKYLWVWFLLLLAGGVLFIRATWELYGKIKKGEVLCWN